MKKVFGTIVKIGVGYIVTATVIHTVAEYGRRNNLISNKKK